MIEVTGVSAAGLFGGSYEHEVYSDAGGGAYHWYWDLHGQGRLR